jgi:hypothetical protein
MRHESIYPFCFGNTISRQGGIQSDIVFFAKREGVIP